MSDTSAMNQEDPPGALEEALARVGDRWSLLVVAALLSGPRRFNDLQADLPGIAPNTLSQRLKHLERQGVVVATPYSRRPPRFGYELTAAGRELAGALRLLAEWGAGGDVDPPRHEACGGRLEVRWHCPTCDQTISDMGDNLRFL